MKRSKKRKIQKECTFNFEMVVKPVNELKTSIKDMLRLLSIYFNDIKLTNMEPRLKYTLYREIQVGVEVRKAQIEQLQNILDECVDEDGRLMDKRFTIYGSKEHDITDETVRFVKLYEKVTTLSIDISDANMGLSKDLNKAIVSVVNELTPKEELADLLLEFKTITARYYGCSVEELEKAMEDAVSMMKAQTDVIMQTAMGQQRELINLTMKGLKGGENGQQPEQQQ